MGNRKQGTEKERGYGWPHQRERAKWKPIVDAGQAHCTAVICMHADRWIEPGTPWDLGHNPARTKWTGPEHRWCNRADGARRGNRSRTRTEPRRWTL